MERVHDEAVDVFQRSTVISVFRTEYVAFRSEYLQFEAFEVHATVPVFVVPVFVAIKRIISDKAVPPHEDVYHTVQVPSCDAIFAGITAV